MDDIVARRAQALLSIRRWAEEEANVRALVQTGSLARDDCLADAFSDLDIELIAADPAALAADDAWIGAIGAPITVLRLDEDDQDWPTRLVIYDGGVKVDFTLAGRARIDDMVEAGALDPLYARGHLVLLDKDGLAAGLPASSGRTPAADLPAEARFRARVEEFWFEAFHVPRYLARGELFLAKQRDWTMKQLLLEMIEWHALATAPEPVDVWHLGARLRHWAGPRVWDEMHGAFGGFDAQGARRGFDVTTTLYARLARETATARGWAYPDAVEARIRATDPIG